MRRKASDEIVRLARDYAGGYVIFGVGNRSIIVGPESGATQFLLEDTVATVNKEDKTIFLGVGKLTVKTKDTENQFSSIAFIMPYVEGRPFLDKTMGLTFEVLDEQNAIILAGKK